MAILSTILVYSALGFYLLALLIRKRLGWARRYHIGSAVTGFILDMSGTGLMEYQRVTGRIHFADLPAWLDGIHLAASFGAIGLFLTVAFLGVAKIRRWSIARWHYPAGILFLVVWVLSAVSGWFY
jgi:hypothetical protein